MLAEPATGRALGENRFHQPLQHRCEILVGRALAAHPHVVEDRALEDLDSFDQRDMLAERLQACCRECKLISV